ncbi:MAG TPA: RNA polymerase sigma factor [Ktedonobacteraceae bacterium]|nr:RNA polymerase sigma factor [Ktedonobacteraceae bacterium]
MLPFNRASRNMKIEELFDRHSAKLFVYLCNHTPSREDAEDLLVETFLSALTDSKFTGLTESAQIAWLWRVAHNKTIDAFRRAAVRQDLSLEHAYETAHEDQDRDPEQVLLRRDEAREVASLLRRLSPQQQEILQLRFSHDLRCHEIAAVLGKSEQTVRTTLSRAMNLLRQLYTQRKEARAYLENLSR